MDLPSSAIPDTPRSDVTPHNGLLLIALFAVGTTIRFAGLGRDAFWFNEAASWFYAKGSAWEVVRHSFVDETNPPGFHLQIHYWERLAGIQEWALRLPGAVTGSLTILLVYGLARRFLSARGALIAAALLAFSPMHIWYSQECRGFVFWVAFLMGAYWSFLTWLDSERPAFLVLNALLIWLGVSFHYFALHAIVIENAYFLTWQRAPKPRRWREWLVSQGVLLLALCPFLAMLATVNRANVEWWRESGVSLETVKALVFHLNGVFFFQERERVFKAALLFGNAIALGTGLWAFRRERSAIFLLLATGLPAVLNVAYSVLVSPILGNSQSAGRYFLFTLPPFLILLARGWEALFERLRVRYVASMVLVVFLAFYLLGIRAMWENEAFRRDDNRRLCRVLFDRAQPGDILVAAPYITVDYYAALLQYPIEQLHVYPTSRFDRDLAALLPERLDRVWLFVDPAHHFAPLLQDLRARYGLDVATEEKEQRMSGVSLILLEKPTQHGTPDAPTGASANPLEGDTAR